MKKRGPDSLEGLYIAIICCLLSTLTAGPSGLSSMLFVACIARYNTDRNSASLPFLLSNVLQAVSGPFTGYLAKRFGIRAVILAGSVLVSLGIGTCFFAEDITAVVILWGIVFGTGYGLSSLLLPAIINDYFIKQRSKALGMCYLGSPIGFFIYPPIFEVLLDKYGLSGTFLFLSGISMNCIPLAMLIRKPDFKGKNEQSSLMNTENKCNSYLSTDYTISNQSEFKDTESSDINSKKNTPYRRFSIEFLWEKSKSFEFSATGSKQYVLSLNKTNTEKTSDNNDVFRSFKISSKKYSEDLDALSKCGKINELNKQTNNVEISNYTNCEENERYFARPLADTEVCENANSEIHISKDQSSYEKCSAIYVSPNQTSHSFVNNKLYSANKTFINHAYQSDDERDVNLNRTNHTSSQMSSTPKLIKYRKTDEFPALKSVHDEEKCNAVPDKDGKTPSPNNSMLNLYFNPIFILMCIVHAISNLHFSTLTTVVIDFSRDIKIDLEYEKYIMMCISLLGGVGMLGFGWVTDGGYLTRTTFGSVMQFISSVSTLALPFTFGFDTLMSALAVWSVCQASFIPLIPAILADFIDEDLQAVSISAVYVLSGPLYLIVPPLIGYFRDEKGSYDNIFFLLGFLAFLNCLAVFTIPHLARWKRKR